MLPRLFLCSCLMTMVAAASAVVARKWTDTSGRSFDGSYVSSTTAEVEVKRADGAVFKIQRTKLSKADNDYIDEQLKKPANSPASAANPTSATMNGAERIHPGWAKRLAGYNNPDPDFTSSWPEYSRVLGEPEITTVTESAADKTYIYESPHFRYESNCALRPSMVAKFALMFEACYEAHKEIPLNNRRTRAIAAEKFKARIFETQEQYNAAGGPKGSAGVYMSGPDAFMVYLDALGVKKVGQGYMFDAKADFKTVFHEVTHLLWADIEMPGMWMTEGFAEYMGTVPYSNGRFLLKANDSRLLTYATDFDRKTNRGRAIGKEFSMPHLKSFMAWDQPKFYSGGHETMNKNYALGLILTYYFADLDDGGKKFREAFRAMQHGKPDEEVRQVLLGSRSYEQLETEFAAAMRKKGLKITFE